MQYTRTQKIHLIDREQEIDRYDVDPGFNIYNLWINQAHVVNGSVGIIIIKEASKNIIIIKRVTNRIMIANFQCNTVLTTIMTYVMIPCEYED